MTAFYQGSPNQGHSSGGGVLSRARQEHQLSTVSLERPQIDHTKDDENSKMGHLLVACLAAEERGVKAFFISRESQKKCLRFTVLSVLGERFTGHCHVRDCF
jgi:hypothetical protein